MTSVGGRTPGLRVAWSAHNALGRHSTAATNAPVEDEARSDTADHALPHSQAASAAHSASRNSVHSASDDAPPAGTEADEEPAIGEDEVDGEVAWIHGVGKQMSPYLQFVQAAMGVGHALFVDAGARLWVLGCGRLGQLGAGGSILHARELLLQPMFAATPIASVAAGRHHSVVLTRSAQVWCFGANAHGQCGFYPSTTPCGSAVPAGRTCRLDIETVATAVWKPARVAEYTWSPVQLVSVQDVGGERIAQRAAWMSALSPAHRFTTINDSLRNAFNSDAVLEAAGELPPGARANEAYKRTTVHDTGVMRLPPIAAVCAAASHTLLLTASGCLLAAGFSTSGAAGVRMVQASAASLPHAEDDTVQQQVFPPARSSALGAATSPQPASTYLIVSPHVAADMAAAGVKAPRVVRDAVHASALRAAAHASYPAMRSVATHEAYAAATTMTGDVYVWGQLPFHNDFLRADEPAGESIASGLPPVTKPRAEQAACESSTRCTSDACAHEDTSTTCIDCAPRLMVNSERDGTAPSAAARVLPAASTRLPDARRAPPPPPRVSAPAARERPRTACAFPKPLRLPCAMFVGSTAQAPFTADYAGETSAPMELHARSIATPLASTPSWRAAQVACGSVGMLVLVHTAHNNLDALPARELQFDCIQFGGVVAGRVGMPTSWAACAAHMAASFEGMDVASTLELVCGGTQPLLLMRWGDTGEAYMLQSAPADAARSHSTDAQRVSINGPATATRSTPVSAVSLPSRSVEAAFLEDASGVWWWQRACVPEQSTLHMLMLLGIKRDFLSTFPMRTVSELWQHVYTLTVGEVLRQRRLAAVAHVLDDAALADDTWLQLGHSGTPAVRAGTSTTRGVRTASHLSADDARDGSVLPLRSPRPSAQAPRVAAQGCVRRAGHSTDTKHAEYAHPSSEQPEWTGDALGITSTPVVTGGESQDTSPCGGTSSGTSPALTKHGSRVPLSALPLPPFLSSHAAHTSVDTAVFGVLTGRASIPSEPWWIDTSAEAELAAIRHLLALIPSHVRATFSDAELLELHRAFSQMDADGSGSLDVFEIQEALNILGCQASERIIAKLIQLVDDNDSGTVEYHEYVMLMWKIRSNTMMTMEAAAAARKQAAFTAAALSVLEGEDASLALAGAQAPDIVSDEMAVVMAAFQSIAPSGNEVSPPVTSMLNLATHSLHVANACLAARRAFRQQVEDAVDDYVLYAQADLEARVADVESRGGKDSAVAVALYAELSRVSQELVHPWHRGLNQRCFRIALQHVGVYAGAEQLLSLFRQLGKWHRPHLRFFQPVRLVREDEFVRYIAGVVERKSPLRALGGGTLAHGLSHATQEADVAADDASALAGDSPSEQQHAMSMLAAATHTAHRGAARFSQSLRTRVAAAKEHGAQLLDSAAGTANAVAAKLAAKLNDLPPAPPVLVSVQHCAQLVRIFRAECKRMNIELPRGSALDVRLRMIAAQSFTAGVCAEPSLVGRTRAEVARVLARTPRMLVALRSGTLDLAHTQLRDTHCVALAFALRCIPLARRLELRGNRISDAGMESLILLAKWQRADAQSWAGAGGVLRLPKSWDGRHGHDAPDPLSAPHRRTRSASDMHAGGESSPTRTPRPSRLSLARDAEPGRTRSARSSAAQLALDATMPTQPRTRTLGTEAEDARAAHDLSASVYDAGEESDDDTMYAGDEDAASHGSDSDADTLNCGDSTAEALAHAIGPVQDTASFSELYVPEWLQREGEQRLPRRLAATLGRNPALAATLPAARSRVAAFDSLLLALRGRKTGAEADLPRKHAALLGRLSRRQMVMGTADAGEEEEVGAAVGHDATLDPAAAGLPRSNLLKRRHKHVTCPNNQCAHREAATQAHPYGLSGMIVTREFVLGSSIVCARCGCMWWPPVFYVESVAAHDTIANGRRLAIAKYALQTEMRRAAAFTMLERARDGRGVSKAELKRQHDNATQAHAERVLRRVKRTPLAAFTATGQGAIVPAASIEQRMLHDAAQYGLGVWKMVAGDYDVFACHLMSFYHDLAANMFTGAVHAHATTVSQHAASPSQMLHFVQHARQRVHAYILQLLRVQQWDVPATTLDTLADTLDKRTRGMSAYLRAALVHTQLDCVAHCAGGSGTCIVSRAGDVRLTGEWPACCDPAAGGGYTAARRAAAVELGARGVLTTGVKLDTGASSVRTAVRASAASTRDPHEPAGAQDVDAPTVDAQELLLETLGIGVDDDFARDGGVHDGAFGSVRLAAQDAAWLLRGSLTEAQLRSARLSTLYASSLHGVGGGDDEMLHTTVRFADDAHVRHHARGGTRDPVVAQLARVSAAAVAGVQPRVTCDWGGGLHWTAEPRAISAASVMQTTSCVAGVEWGALNEQTAHDARATRAGASVAIRMPPAACGYSGSVAPAAQLLMAWVECALATTRGGGNDDAVCVVTTSPNTVAQARSWRRVSGHDEDATGYRSHEADNEGAPLDSRASDVASRSCTLASEPLLSVHAPVAMTANTTHQTTHDAYDYEARVSTQWTCAQEVDVDPAPQPLTADEVALMALRDDVARFGWAVHAYRTVAHAYAASGSSTPCSAPTDEERAHAHRTGSDASALVPTTHARSARESLIRSLPPGSEASVHDTNVDRVLLLHTGPSAAADHSPASATHADATRAEGDNASCGGGSGADGGDNSADGDDSAADGDDSAADGGDNSADGDNSAADGDDSAAPLLLLSFLLERQTSAFVARLSGAYVQRLQDVCARCGAAALAAVHADTTLQRSASAYTPPRTATRSVHSVDEGAEAEEGNATEGENAMAGDATTMSTPQRSGASDVAARTKADSPFSITTSVPRTHTRTQGDAASRTDQHAELWGTRQSDERDATGWSNSADSTPTAREGTVNGDGTPANARTDLSSVEVTLLQDIWQALSALATPSEDGADEALLVAPLVQSTALPPASSPEASTDADARTRTWTTHGNASPSRSPYLTHATVHTWPDAGTDAGSGAGQPCLSPYTISASPVSGTDTDARLCTPRVLSDSARGARRADAPPVAALPARHDSAICSAATTLTAQHRDHNLRSAASVAHPLRATLGIMTRVGVNGGDLSPSVARNAAGAMRAVSRVQRLLASPPMSADDARKDDHSLEATSRMFVPTSIEERGSVDAVGDVELAANMDALPLTEAAGNHIAASLPPALLATPSAQYMDVPLELRPLDSLPATCRAIVVHVWAPRAAYETALAWLAQPSRMDTAGSAAAAARILLQDATSSLLAECSLPLWTRMCHAALHAANVERDRPPRARRGASSARRWAAATPEEEGSPTSMRRRVSFEDDWSQSPSRSHSQLQQEPPQQERKPDAAASDEGGARSTAPPPTRVRACDSPGSAHSESTAASPAAAASEASWCTTPQQGTIAERMASGAPLAWRDGLWCAMPCIVAVRFRAKLKQQAQAQEAQAQDAQAQQAQGTRMTLRIHTSAAHGFAVLGVQLT